MLTSAPGTLVREAKEEIFVLETTYEEVLYIKWASPKTHSEPGLGTVLQPIFYPSFLAQSEEVRNSNWPA
jgi:hypothetical protein